jgi:hypothetical protein
MAASILTDPAAVAAKLELLGYATDPVDDAVELAADPPPSAGGCTTLTVTVTLAAPLEVGQGLAVFVPYAFSKPQVSLPAMEGYTTVRAEGPARLDVGDLPAPRKTWERAVRATIAAGGLPAGAPVVFTFGDTTGGSPGLRCPTRALRSILVECCRVRVRGEQPAAILRRAPMISVAPGPAAMVRGFATATLGVGETGRLLLAAEDAFGNAAPDFVGPVQLRAAPFEGLPAVVRMAEKDRGRVELPFTARRAGVFYPMVGVGGRLTCAGPVEVTAAPPPLRLYFGELHAHTELSYDARGEVDEFYQFARDTAGLDFASITDHMAAAVNRAGTPAHGSCSPGLSYARMPRRWAEIVQAARRFHEPHRFVTFLAFEADSVGPANHRNIYWKTGEGEPYDMQGREHGTVEQFKAWCQGRDVLVVPHHPAIWWNPGPARGQGACRLEEGPADKQPIVEIYSKHGTSEHAGNHRPLRGHAGGGFVWDLLEAGHRFGLVAGSDTHWANPGSSSIEAGPFDTLQYRSGLAAVWARELTREAIWEAIFARRTFATTYPRVILRVRAGDVRMGQEGACPHPRRLEVELFSPLHVNRVELIRNAELIAAHPPESHPPMPAYSQGSFGFDDPAPTGRPVDWYVVRVWMANGERAWSSPLWLANA